MFQRKCGFDAVWLPCSPRNLIVTGQDGKLINEKLESVEAIADGSLRIEDTANVTRISLPQLEKISAGSQQAAIYILDNSELTTLDLTRLTVVNGPGRARDELVEIRNSPDLNGNDLYKQLERYRFL